MHPPPTDLNVTNPAKNQSQFWWRPFFFVFFFFLETTWIWAKKTFEFPISAEKSVSILVKTFFFFFFGDHLNLGEKNVWISDFGQKITLNFGEDIRIFEVLCFKSPPPKFSGSATDEQHTSSIRCITRNLQWGRAVFGGLKAEPQALKNFFFFQN